MSFKENQSKSYNDLIIKFNNLQIDYNQLEQEIIIKTNTINDQLVMLSNYETILTNLKHQVNEDASGYFKSVEKYKGIIEDYKLNLIKVNNELNYYKNLEFSRLENADLDESTDGQDYNKLLKDYKILQSNYEIETNNKVALINQVEELTKQLNEYHRIGELGELGEFEKNQIEAIQEVEDFETSNEIVSDNTSDVDHLEEVINDGYENNQDITYNYTSYLNNITDGSDDDDLDKEVPVEEVPQSSPIKDRLPSLIHDESFQFPPSPDPDSRKRQSLPINLPKNWQQEFVLSPLKLQAKRHSRYNSDLKIKVEFEPQDQQSHTDPQENTLNDINYERFMEYNKEAFDKLNSSDSSRSSFRSTIRSYRNNTTEYQILEEGEEHAGVNKELTELKFELQSLKLHNEKLLSFISFELQRNNKKIKKLSSRNFEYSDNKLIKNSKKLLSKKKILRSASINSILSTGIHGDLKKFKSMNFKFVNDIDDSLLDYDFTIDKDLDNVLEIDEIEVPPPGIFSQLKHLLIGNNKNTVDDNLKYQFLTITIGILILGIRFGSYNHSQ